MSNLIDFINSELYPTLFNMVDKVFPTMGFVRYKGGWASPKKIDGTEPHSPRPEKCQITRKVPNRILEQGGENLSLIDFYMRLNNVDFIGAVKAMADICGLQVPQRADSGEYKAYKEKQDKLEAISDKMKKALFTDKGKEVLSYLKEGRGYEEEFIKWAEFGAVSEEVLSELNEAFRYIDKDGKEWGLPYGVGTTYTLAIPYRSGSSIKGFVFRSIRPIEPKYKDAFLSASASKRFHLYGLQELKLFGNKKEDTEIVIVEGEIDALRASYEGVTNVVAASGGTVSPEAIQEAKRLGAKSATILFDTEETDEKKRENNEKVKKAIEIIYSKGLSPFVCYLQEDAANKKQDVDSFLKTHTGEELKAVIKEARPAPIFLYYLTINHAIERTEGGSFTFKNQEQFKRETIELCNSEHTPPTYRDKILTLLAQDTGLTKEALQEEADTLKQIEAEQRQRGEATTLFSEAYTLSRDGKQEEAFSLVGKKLSEIKSISKEATFSSLLNLPTKEEIMARRADKPMGVKTGFAFEHNGEKEELLLPPGALTYICAPTSHGKSRMLENLALNLATDGTEGTTLYFSYEESKTDVETELLNIYANIELSKNNLRTLQHYYTSGDLSKVKGYNSRISGENAEAQNKIRSFKQKEAEFDALLMSGKLRVFYEDYDSTELIEAIRFIAKQTKVKAVFIDYIQLLHKKGCSLQRKDELKEICKDFMSLSVETKLPVVLAAQLNREAYSPIDMSVQNIAEASDIEHSANIVLLLWNSRVKASLKGTFNDSKGKLSLEAEKLQDRGFTLGQDGKLYATLAKNRGGARGIDAVLDFCGNTGRIKQNAEQFEPKQTSLYNDPF